MSDRLPGSGPSNPIEYREWYIHLNGDHHSQHDRWMCYHSDHDGDPDDSRYSYEATDQACRDYIDEYWEDKPDAPD